MNDLHPWLSQQHRNFEQERARAAGLVPVAELLGRQLYRSV
jgi:hypothetical protein